MLFIAPVTLMGISMNENHFGKLSNPRDLQIRLQTTPDWIGLLIGLAICFSLEI